MTGCKISIWKILSAGVALLLVLPSLALGEVGVCPPYSKTFGPDDQAADIIVHINTGSTRAGGSTTRLLPGTYDLSGLTAVSGVVCIEGIVETDVADVTISNPDLVVLAGGLLTLRSVASPDVSVQNGGALLVQNARLPELAVEAGGFSRVDRSRLGSARNAGVMLVVASENTGGGDTFLDNSGYLYLDRVLMHGMYVHKYNCCESVLSNSGVATIKGSTIAWNHGDQGSLVAIENFGHLEIFGSIVAENMPFFSSEAACYNEGEFIDLGYNVFGPLGEGGGACTLTETTSVEAEAGSVFVRFDSLELLAGGPALDRIPLARCPETDALGRARTDGDNDGVIACDAGALEYGHASVEVVVRTPPYWRSVGRVDLSRDSPLFVAVMSGGRIDPTSIVFDSIVVGDFPRSAMRGVVYHDKNGDDLPDYNFWYRLDRKLVLECRYYDEPFTAMTDDGQEITGRLQFEAVGCTP